MDTPIIKIEVSLFEASLIKKLRTYEFGTFTVHKIKGEPRRIEIGGSEMLDELAGKSLAVKEGGE